MSNNTKSSTESQQSVKIKPSYESLRTVAEEALIKEEKDLNATKKSLGYSNLSWPELINIDIKELGQAQASQMHMLQETYNIYLQNKQQFDTTIYVEPAKVHEVVDAAEKLLLVEQNNIYQRSSKLVRVTQVSNKPSANKLVKRAADAMLIKEIDQSYLIVYLTRVGHFVHFDSRSGSLKKIDCPDRIARLLLAKQEWNIPILTGIINAPTLRSDGSILDKPGYDTISGLLFFSRHCQFEAIPENPTLQDAINAKNELMELLSEFPFEDEASKSVVLAAILTVLIRKSLETAPLFGFTAPKMASGKSLLSDIVALIGTGKANSVIAQADSEAEEKKRIMAVLSEGDAVVCYDNIERPFKSAALCSILTQHEYKDRMLGSNETRTVLTNATFLVTGNNLVFMGDISTRALLCTLDPKIERPEERSFKLDLRKHITQHRARFVNAGLTILRAYHVAGRPPQNIKPFGRFETWSDWVRSSIVWVTMVDPCESRKEIEESDPVRILLHEFFTAWYEIFESYPIKVKDLLSPMSFLSEDQRSEEKLEACTTLQEALVELAGDNKGIINVKKLARQLSLHKKRIESGLRLEKVGTKQKTALWCVVKILTN